MTLIPDHIFIYDKNIVRISLSHKNTSAIDLIFNLTMSRFIRSAQMYFIDINKTINKFN
ncbi:hypothetical protein [Salmonella enterica subsp. enterica serovar Kentucky]|uniref:Uncharacterized protein n=1 Tax=Salmonella enterica subsp. enterica serovar Senftenberg str. A4-543 TaxID=913082 RepID=G5R2J6_SALSE|nr:hypothetical protein LTSESEN_3615 [Salmonella enterica subsp. enterica serovar Senftenberg str. A4-543]ESG77320.1 hypothetical protein SEEK9263_12216 [Salmonella enterica subsp. enterica serovar Kentucky str. ATCC 9263]CAI3064905.1 hypothetical protein [Salmonella enterica subsp. enterica serovar Kentucky]